MKINQNATLGEVTMETQNLVASDPEEMIWPDTFGWDQDGNLWVTSNKLVFILNQKLDWSLPDSNFRLLKMNVDDKGYLMP